MTLVCPLIYLGVFHCLSRISSHIEKELILNLYIESDSQSSASLDDCDTDNRNMAVCGENRRGI